MLHKVMGYHISNSLFGTYLVMSSDEDAPIVRDIVVGFNQDKNVTVSLDHYDYEQKEYNCSTAFVVNQIDGFKLARKLNIPYKDLPHYIALYMEDWRKIINPTLYQVKDCFCEIYDNFLAENCRLRMIYTYGKKGYQC